jgi:phosphoserine phosphatase RsbU/P
VIRLHVVMPDGSPLEREFGEGSILIGRSSRADLSLADRSLSREHARVYHSGDAWMVEDCGSRNGTFLNGQPVRQPAPLRSGDSLSLGSVALSVTLDAADMEGSPGFGEHTVLRPAAELLRDSGVSTAVTSGPSDSASLRRLAERLHALNEVHQALAHSISLKELLEMILDRAFDHLKPEQGAIFLKEPSGGYQCAASRSLAGAGDRFVYSKSLIREVAEKGMAALVLDTTADSRFNQAMSLLSVGVRSLIAAPLLDDRGALGMMVLGSRVAVRAFREEDLELLVPLASVAAMRIRNIALAEEAAERRRLEEEIALARRIQVALLPDSLPDVPGYEIHGGNIPSRGVSGDYYEVVNRLDGRETVFLVADVSGKGIAAALLTASVEALSVAPIEDGKAPDVIFDRVSRQLYERTPPEKYATGFIAVLERERGTLRYCNAGHCPTLVLSGKDGVEWLGTNGPPLGLLPGSTYTAGSIDLRVGDVVVFYTDGITEANDPAEEEYGRERLAAICGKHRDKPLDEIARLLEEDLDGFANGEPYADDRTLVMLRRTA